MDRTAEGAVDFLPRSDVERLLDLAVDVLEARTPDRVWRLVAGELLRALDAAAVVLEEARGTAAADGRVAVWRRDGRGASAAGGAFGGRHVLGVPLPGRGGGVRTFLVYRDVRDFTARDRLYCALLQPLLRAAAARCEGLADAGAVAVADAGAVADPAARTGRGGAAGSAALTGRETTVLRMLSQGLPAAAMARRLGISVRTVHKHLENLYRKLDTVDRLETVLRAQETGLLTAERAG
ncbi:helix-turn-helix transcriptional regulator [Streptomyces roseolilacinus]|uniref:helix-turn-helix transcriptional regulator n=1 Tax=Streptomyces roseolilacinus TaxID=66904 RepID=UPI003824A867